MSGEIVALEFSSRTVLTKALDRMVNLDYVNIKRGAVIAKSSDGELRILEDDVSPDQGAIVGTGVGAAVSILGMVQFGALALPGVGPVLAISSAALAGAMVGRMTGRFVANRVEFGVPEEALRMLADQLHSGHPALVLELQNARRIIERLKEDLGPYRFEVIGLPAAAAA
jgi:uncharacterized membrane protein